MRNPDYIIGGVEDPYIKRWWVIPRNKVFNIYLHQILRSDNDEAFHDHPWWNLSIILRRGYWEHSPKGVKWRGKGSIVLRKATALHRLVVTEDKVGTWSLFITGPVIRVWGFACPKGWIPWQQFVNVDGKVATSKGCGE